MKHMKLLAVVAVLAMLLSMTLLAPWQTSAQTILGDANGDDTIDMKDVLIIRKYLAGMVESYNLDLIASDCNQDNSIDMKDVLLLRKYLAHMEDLPELVTTTKAPTTTTQSTPTSAPTKPINVTYQYTTLVPDQLVLSYYNQDSTDMAITWHTTKESKKAVVQYMKADPTVAPDFSQATTVDALTEEFEENYCFPYFPETNNYTWDAKAGFKTAIAYVHRGIMTNLEPGTNYVYRVGDADENVWSDAAVFTTREADPSDFSFVYISDTQAEPIEQDYGYKFMKNTLKYAEEDDPDMDFILHGGDVVQGTRYYFLWESMLNGSKEFLTKYPMMLTTGNHEGTQSTAGKFETYKHMTFDLPDVAMDKAFGVYYSFNYDNTHFIVLNTDSSSTTSGSLDRDQIHWFKDDVKSKTQKWTIVSIHQTMLSLKKTKNPALLDLIIDECNDYGVDLVIQAHEHCYMQSYPVDTNKNITTKTATEIDGVSYYENPKGVLFATFATAGSKPNNVTGAAAASFCKAYSGGKPSSWGNIHITDDKLTIKAYYVTYGNEEDPDTDNGKALWSQGQWGIIKTDN